MVFSLSFLHTRSSRFLSNCRAFLSSARKKDPYEVLGVPKSASASAIKKAYLALAKQYHPDTNKENSAKDKFVEIQAAYDILSDEKKKASYDAHGFEDETSSYSSPQPDPADIFNAFFGAGRSGKSRSSSPFDPFADLFGHGTFTNANKGRRISEDIQMKITLTFLEAALGCTKQINISRWENCVSCSGSGMSPGSTMAKCTGCNGRGSKVFSRGGMVIEIPCDTCDGSGTYNPNPCKKCSGEGILRSTSPAPVEIKIPSGVDNSTQLVIENLGNALGSGSMRHGNLLLQFKVQESPIFKREGNDIYQTASVPLLTCLLGGNIRIPSLSGEVDLIISPCSIQPGDVKRLRGKGIHNESTRKQGDMYVTLNVEIPSSLTTHQKMLLKEWGGSSSDGDGSSSTTSKIKDWIRERVSGNTDSCSDK